MDQIVLLWKYQIQTIQQQLYQNQQFQQYNISLPGGASLTQTSTGEGVERMMMEYEFMILFVIINMFRFINNAVQGILTPSPKHLINLSFLALIRYECQNVPFPIEQQHQKCTLAYILEKSIKPIFNNFKRFIQLLLIFSPSLLTLPLVLLPWCRKLWLKMFVWSVERAGVVWIKLFQYLSHRRDVIGEEMAQSFSHLRQFSPQHTLSQTKQIFRRIYGAQPSQLFQQFNEVPIASGSVSQVYAAKLEGKKVAIKVKHPNIQQHIDRDISIVFGISRLLSIISKAFQIPVNEHSLKKMLGEQIYFLKQKQNLIKFRTIFTNPRVKFPQPHSLTSDEVLVMSFVEGKPITYYQQSPHEQNKIIARVGAAAFFQMLIQHNFIHADCHGGNIFINLIEHRPILKYVQYYVIGFKNYVWNKMIRFMLQSKKLKKLADDHMEEEKLLHKQQVSLNHRVEISVLDAGMVITLQKDKREYFINFLSQIIQGNPTQCAKMIHRISKYGGTLLQDDEHPKYLSDLQEMFTLVQKCSLENIHGIQVLSGMLRVIREHRMKLDGQFATLLTNMLILEGIAKDLDPSINILRCAVPYLPYK